MSTAGDQPDRDGDTERTPGSDGSDEQERLDVDARFAAIVANWGDEPPAAWPAQEDVSGTEQKPPSEPPTPGRLRSSEWGTDWNFAGEDPLPGGQEIRGLGPMHRQESDDLPPELRGNGPRDYALEPEPETGYEPPDPPPLPKGDLLGRLAWAAVIGGPLFLLICALAWQPPDLLIMIALAAFAGGFITLVARMPKHRDDDDDDGAVV